MIVISAHKIVMPPQIAVLRPWSAAASFPLPIRRELMYEYEFKNSDRIKVDTSI